MTLAETTKTHNDHTKIHYEDYKGMHHNSTRITKDHIKHLETVTATLDYIYESSATAASSEATYIAAATTTTDSTAVYSEPPYIAAASTLTDTTLIEAFGTGLITASVSAQDFTSSLAPSYASNTVLAISTNYTQSTLVAPYPYATGFTPSAGLATTSRAVFTGSCGRRSVDYLLVAVLPALVGMFMWA
jgi:hypothetical protein